jgi:signal transduction histidine kinase
MKLTKQLEAEVMDVYEAYWGGLLNVDMETYAAVLDNDFRLIGTTEVEMFFKKIEAVRFLEETAEQVAGNIKLQNRVIKVEAVDTSMLITEQADTYVNIDEVWVFYGKVRCSSLLQKKNAGWKFIQMHLSFPDTKAAEGETVGLEKISKENLELREAIKRRTTELEHSNNELKIEAALERVRTVAMAMQQPHDMLDICQVISDELKNLGVAEIRNIQTAIIDINKDSYLNYEYFRLQKKKIVTPVEYKKHKDVHAFVKKMMKDPEGFFTKQFKGVPLRQYIQYQKKAGQFVDPATKKAVSLHYYFYSIGPGALGISTYAPLTKDAIDLFKRFRNVFQLAYRRFIDIEKAIAQTREAEIELALERVRARTMAMQQSEELAEASFLLDSQVRALGIKTRGCAFNIYGDNESTEWFSSEAGTMPTYKTPREKIFLRYYEAGLAGKAIHIETIEGKACAAHYQYLCTLPVMGDALKEMKANGGSFPVRQTDHVVYFKYGYLLFITLDPVPESHDIFIRFAKVFEQTYTRFLDLQKAEAQARESQIQLALERVRARTMAMQHSNELPDAATILFQQVQSLGMPAWSAGYCTWNENKSAVTLWMSSEGVLQPAFTAPTTEDELFIQMRKGQEDDKTFHVVEMGGKKLVKHYEYMRTLPVVGEILDSIINAGHPLPGFQIMHHAYFSKGFLLFITYEPVPDAHDIFKRFGKVFDQTYTRFLDLQKAESQGREAEIELALERVRARTMAMQQSDELREVVMTIYEQLQHLDFNAHACNIVIADKLTGNREFWVAGFTKEIYPESYKVPYINHPYVNKQLDAWKHGEKYAVFEYTGKMKKDFDAIFFSATDFKNIPDDAKRIMIELPAVTFSTAFFNYGSLQALGKDALSTENADILQRFAKVFEQTYTRFLDLQKAEAQSKEAQIETALERVRSRSMGMQKSEEFKEVIKIVYQQLSHLKINLDHAGFVVDYTPKGDWHFWIADEQDIPSKITHPYFDSVWANQFNEAKEKGADFFATHLNFEEKNKFYYELLSYVPGLPEASKYFYLNCPGLAASTVLLDTVGLYIENFSGIAYTDDENNTVVRFGKVFQQSYTRFLDLQKAEAQAREAQIETALERVRSRTMAMHKSDELKEIIIVLSEQLQKLGYKFSNVSFITHNANYDLKFWMSAPGVKEAILLQVPYLNNPAINSLKQMVENDIWFSTDILTANESLEWNQHVIKTTWLNDAPQETKNYLLRHTPLAKTNIRNKHIAFAIGNYAGTPYKDEENEVFKRFANVFEQSYTRFLDLQKAEAQAREAQIEAALERVRSRTMAMQHSSELSDTARLLFQQIKSLGVPPWSCGFNIWEKGDTVFTSYMGSPDGVILEGLKIPLMEDATFIHFHESRERGDALFIDVLEGEALEEHYRYFLSLPEIKKAFEKRAQAGEHRPTFQINHLANFSHGNLMFITYEPCPEAHDIFIRFAKVFEQTYTRFLDLQKAEAQAKEAQIEAALERVRSRSMAMHKSDELLEAGEILFLQMQKLGIESLTAGYVLIDKEEKNGLNYTPDPSTKKILPLPIIIPHNETIQMRNIVTNWKKEGSYYIVEMDEEETTSHQTFIAERSTNFTLNAAQLIAISPARLFLHNFYFKEGYVLIVGGTKLSAEQTDIMLRFTKVFQQTYTRFLDLQKAEAQAKEAQIESALERVRSRSLAMHHSSELSAVVDTLLREFTNLEFTLTFCIINLINEQDRSNTVWAANPETGKDPESYYMKFEDYPFHHAMWDAWKEQQKNFIYTIEGEEKKIYDEYLYTKTEFRHFPTHVQEANKALKRYVAGFTFFKYSGLQTVSENQISEDELKILERFGRVFEQSYTRFLDLQKAEAQAREAQIEAALEKVRSRSLAMQKPEELIEVAELLRKEMGQLGVEELETSSIYIVDKENEQAECWYAIKDIREENKKLVSDEMTITFADSWVGNEMLKFYQSKMEQASIVMKGDNRKGWINYCAEKSNVLQGYYGDEIPERTYHLVKFNGGYMGAASPADISAESWDLLRRAASVFSLAYTRFNDLQIAETHARQAEQDLIAIKEAKQKAEQALTELQATQKQLIQSEKMASLGELTAGIAHEIQNPLNFVNNFSEVSTELVDEMNTEIDKGNLQDAKEIANDLKQNLEKINHHGKRAGDIVKGMLQHSRSTNNATKEPTDINALADEYLRLAYHGLRAKDKTFNATMKTDFDETIGNINIIPQDMGRVILNLITNAFYVVNEKKTLRQAQGDSYKPTVSVSTKKVGDKVEVKVADNGNGIPQKILDKIFQPFFTTKPTGQGTGLGLSLSYDIVKAHGGELKVETKEGKGSEFIISLPI